MPETKQKFIVTHLHRDDLNDFIGETKAQALTDEQMQTIAENLADELMYYWNECIDALNLESTKILIKKN